MKHPVTSAEDAIDAVVDQPDPTGERLERLRYIAAYAMARFRDVITDEGTGGADLVAFAQCNSVPPVTDRTRRRRQRAARRP